MKQEAQWPIDIRRDDNLPNNHGNLIKQYGTMSYESDWQ